MYRSRHLFVKNHKLCKFAIINTRFLTSCLKTNNQTKKTETNHFDGLSFNTLSKRLYHSNCSKLLVRSKATSSVKNKHEAVEEKTLDFEDFMKAFQAKSTWEITRALMVYKLCSIDAIVERNKTVSHLI